MRLLWTAGGTKMRTVKIVSEEIEDICCDKCGRIYDEDMRMNGDGDEFITCPICGRDLCNRCYGRSKSISELGYYCRDEICEDCCKFIDFENMNKEIDVIRGLQKEDDQRCIDQIEKIKVSCKARRNQLDEARKYIAQKYVDEAKEKINKVKFDSK